MLLLGVQLGSHPPLLSWQAQLIHCTLAMSLFSLFLFLWLKRKQRGCVPASCSCCSGFSTKPSLWMLVALQRVLVGNIFKVQRCPRGHRRSPLQLTHVHVSFAEMTQKKKTFNGQQTHLQPFAQPAGHARPFIGWIALDLWLCALTAEPIRRPSPVVLWNPGDGRPVSPRQRQQLATATTALRSLLSPRDPVDR